MALSTLPPAFPVGTDIVPFTTRWGGGLLGMVEQTRYYIDNTLVPYINDGLGEFVGEISADMATLNASVVARLAANENTLNTRLTENEVLIAQRISDNLAAVDSRLDANETEVSAQLTENLATISAAVQQVITSSIEVQDPVLAGILATPDAASRVYLNGLLADQRDTTRDTDYASLDDAFAATPDFGVLIVQQEHERGGPLLVNKPCTIRFERGGEIVITSRHVNAIDISSSDVTIDLPRLRGTGGTIAGLGNGIRALGTFGFPLERIHILNPDIEGFGYAGVYVEHVRDFSILDVAIRSVAYAGVMILSCLNGSVNRGSIRNVIQPSGYVNSYGVALSRNTTGDIDTDKPRSENIIVENLEIDGVTQWEGLDTHAGKDCTFRHNRVKNCRTGIALIGSKGQVGEATMYAPINVNAYYNDIDSGLFDGTAGVGIIMAGAIVSVNEVTAYATGRIIGNTISNYGTPSSSSGSSIQLYATLGAKVTGNTIINSGFSGIDIFHNNQGLTVADNTLMDVWSNTAADTFCIQVRSQNNKVLISGTTIVRGSKTAVVVNSRGLNIASAAINNTIRDGGGNDWASATSLPTAGDITTSETRFYGKKTGFNGNAPVAKAAAIPSPAETLTSLKASQDAMRKVLSDVGLTS